MSLRSAFTLGQPGISVRDPIDGLIFETAFYEDISTTPNKGPGDPGFDPVSPLIATNRKEVFGNASISKYDEGWTNRSRMDDGENYGYIHSIRIIATLAIGGTCTLGAQNIRLKCGQFTAYNESCGSYDWTKLTGSNRTHEQTMFVPKRKFEVGAGYATRYGQAYIEHTTVSGVAELVYYRSEVKYAYLAD